MTTETASASVEAQASTPSPEQVALASIIAEAGCTPAEARTTLAMIRQAVTNIRCGGYYPYHMPHDVLAGRTYEIFDAVMPHGVSAQPDSAHAAIEACVLDLTLGEISLMHDVATLGERTYCTVSVYISRN